MFIYEFCNVIVSDLPIFSSFFSFSIRYQSTKTSINRRSFFSFVVFSPSLSLSRLFYLIWSNHFTVMITVYVFENVHSVSKKQKVTLCKENGKGSNISFYYFNAAAGKTAKKDNLHEIKPIFIWYLKCKRKQKEMEKRKLPF